MIDKAYERELKALILRTNLYAKDEYRQHSSKIKEESVKKLLELIAFSSQDTKDALYNLLVELLSLQNRVIELEKKVK